MNKKILFFVVTTLFLVIALFSAPLTFAQIPWDYCEVVAYGTNVVEETIGTILRTTFTVATPPPGSNITNTIYVLNYDTGENYTETLSAGEEVRIRYDDIIPDVYEITTAEDPSYKIIYYEGPVARAMISGIDIPEFSFLKILS